MNPVGVSRRSGNFSSLGSAGILLLSLGCGGSSAEVERARQAEAEAIRRLRECETQLAEARQALQAARKSSSPQDDEATEPWRAAQRTAEVFLVAVNGRNADAANAVGSKLFRENDGGKQAIAIFANGRFRGDPKGYHCALPTRLEAVPGKDEFVCRGGLRYRDVPRQDSAYTLRLVKEGESWRVASFTAVER